MKFEITKEFIDDMNYCNKLMIQAQNLVAYMQPRICSMINTPIRVEFDTSYSYIDDNGNATMGCICFGIIKINILNIKALIKTAFYTNATSVYLSYMISHELFHSGQLIDHTIYGTNEYHTWYVESAAIYNAIEFITNHYKDITSILGMSEDEYLTLSNFWSDVVLKSHYPFYNTKIDQINLVDYYIDLISRKTSQKVKDIFINALLHKPNLAIKVCYVDDIRTVLTDYDSTIDTFIVDRYIVSQCILKKNGKIRPVNNEIIDTIDYLDGFKAFHVPKNYSSRKWFSSVVYHGNHNITIIILVRELQSDDSRIQGFGSIN